MTLDVITMIYVGNSDNTVVSVPINASSTFRLEDPPPKKWGKRKKKIVQYKYLSLCFFSFQAEFYIGLEKWTKAEAILQRILKQDPEHDVALYQLSQVYLEQNQTILGKELCL